jgi:hypothetical protein
MDLEAAEFPTVEVNVPPEERRDEQLGSKSKFWFTRSEAEPWLFKRGRANEDWSEKVAAELAGHLGLPAFLHGAQRRLHARDYWLSQLEATDGDFVRGALQRIPERRISTSYRKFAYEIITFNRGRLLAARTRTGNG